MWPETSPRRTTNSEAKPNKIASVWLYEGTVSSLPTVVVNSVRLEVYADTVKPPFKLQAGSRLLVVGSAVTIAVGRNGARRRQNTTNTGKRRRGIEASRDLTDDPTVANKR